MARQRSPFSRLWSLLTQPSTRRKSPAHRLRLERLEDRTVPSVALLPDGSKFIVRFTADAEAPDTLVLRANNAGQLEYQFYQFNNVTPFSTDLDTATPGVQAKPLSALSKIEVSLGGGDDLLNVDASTNPDVIPAPSGIQFTAGPGNDTLAVTQDTNLTLTPTSLTTGNGRTVSFTGVEQARLTGGNGDNLLSVSPLVTFPVTLDGSNGNDSLYGGGGNDVLLGQVGSDFVDGGGGNDQLFSSNSGTTMYGGAGDDTLYGGNGKDVSYGGDGNDLLLGDNGIDQLYGEGGNDTLDGGGGNDLLDGGPGTDRVFSAGNSSYTVSDTTLTGDGTDSLVSIEEAQLTGGTGNNTLDASAFTGATILTGGGGNDTLIGGTGHNLFLKPVGELGNVTMIGGPAGSTNEYCLWPQGTTHLISTGGFDQINFKIAASAITFDLNIINGTAQVVDAAGSTVALTGPFEELLGSDFGDTVIAASGTMVMGGGGPDTLMSNGKTQVALVGGADADSLQQQDGVNIVMKGDDGLDSLTSTRGTGITMNGGADADTLLQQDSANIVMSGDSGLDALTSINGSGITMNGGADADSLQQTDGATIVMRGDDGLDSLTSTRGTGITMNGGADADSLQQQGGTDIVMRGDDGLDTLTSLNGTRITMNGGADADSLLAVGGTTIVMSGDDGLDTLTSLNGSGITMNGGADADLVQQQGGTDMVMAGDDGLDTLVSVGGSRITMNGGADADSLQQQGSTDIVMRGDDGLDTFLSIDGSRITMNGNADADTLIQRGGTEIVMSGDDGLDSLNNRGGTDITMNGGRDADSLLQSQGTRIVMAGDDGLDALTSRGGTDITMNGNADADSLLQEGGTRITMNGGADADTLVSKDGTQIVMAGDFGDDSLTVSGSVNDTLTGGAGNDTYVFAGAFLGSVLLTEAALPAPDTSVDTLDFSSFTGGAITLDLAVTAAQIVSPNNLLTLSDGLGIENAVGTGFADTIRGNARDNQLLGADLLPLLASPPAWNGITQVVFLDFDAATDPGEHSYTQAERDAIQARLVADYVGPNPLQPWFHFQFTQTQPASGDYATLFFNQTPNVPEQETGGFANELDFRNLNRGTAAIPSTASIQVNGILGAPNQPPDTTDNWVALSAKIGGHELGHLVGLLHQDSFGPIGYGIHAPPGVGPYTPDYLGPAAAFETFDHLLSSPASVGSDRFNDIRDLFFGEREAIKLAFAESGTVVAEQAAAHGTLPAAQPVTITPLAVPNTLSSGLNSMKQFAVEAVDVVGSIQIDPGTGFSESDFYSLTGKKGDLISIEVLSKALSRLAGNTIDPIVRVYDSGGSLVAFYSGQAVNDDQFEPTDSSLLDLRLPADGTYFVEVDTFFSTITPDLDTGAYELLIYRFDSGNANDVGDLLEGRGGNDVLRGGLGDDVLDGGAGNDVLDGGADNDTIRETPGSADGVLDSGGTDTLDLSGATLGITLNLVLNAGQVQVIDLAGNTLALTGVIDNVIGSNFADALTGNDADNVLNGGLGNDTLKGGLGNDILLGGEGDDRLEGEAGRNLLIGGNGIDSLVGLTGDDILIGSRTTFDANTAALKAVMAEWTSGHTYAQRVAFLTGTSGGANGSTFLLKNTTVLDDNKAKDTLTGGAGMDLFFSFPGDRVTGREPLESVL